MGDDIRPWLLLQRGDLRCQVATGYPGGGPGSLAQRLREDDLGDVVHRCRVRFRRARPVGRHLLVRRAAHEVGSRLDQPVHLPPDEFSVLGDAHSWMFPITGNISVEGHAHLQRYSSHVILPISTLESSNRTRPYVRLRQTARPAGIEPARSRAQISSPTTAIWRLAKPATVSGLVSAIAQAAQAGIHRPRHSAMGRSTYATR